MKIILVRLVLCLLTILGLTACGNPSLPQEAKDLLYQELTVGYGFEFTIVSAQKVSDEYDGGYDEMWCVVVNPPIPRGSYIKNTTTSPGFTIARRALLWVIQQGDTWGGVIFGHTEESFLALGCTNFPR